MRTPLFLANWKMHMRPAEVAAYAVQFLEKYRPVASGQADTGFAAPFTSLASLQTAFTNAPTILRGAQNLHWLDQGAHTGEISAPMLLDSGVNFVLVGHSERRQFYGETDQAVAKRAKAAVNHGLMAVLCVGESQEQFEAKQTLDVVSSQLKLGLADLEKTDLSLLTLAYEPVWAIGTGLAATAEIAESVHAFIRQELHTRFGPEADSLKILYGGSTKPENITELLEQENIDGALVGGCSLQPDSFLELVLRGRAAKGL